MNSRLEKHKVRLRGLNAESAQAGRCLLRPYALLQVRFQSPG